MRFCVGNKHRFDPSYVYDGNCDDVSLNAIIELTCSPWISGVSLELYLIAADQIIEVSMTQVFHRAFITCFFVHR